MGVCLCEYKVLFGRSNLDCSESRMDIGSQGSGFDMCLNCLPPPSPFFKGRGCRRRVRGTVGSSKKLLSQHSVNPSPQPSSLVNGRGGAPHGFDFHPLAASLSLFGGLSQQMVGGEDCLSVASSAAAPYAALRPREISGSGVAFFLDTFSWLSKKKYLASRARATKCYYSLRILNLEHIRTASHLDCNNVPPLPVGSSYTAFRLASQTVND